MDMRVRRRRNSMKTMYASVRRRRNSSTNFDDVGHSTNSVIEFRWIRSSISSKCKIQWKSMTSMTASSMSTIQKHVIRCLSIELIRVRRNSSKSIIDSIESKTCPSISSIPLANMSWIYENSMNSMESSTILEIRRRFHRIRWTCPSITMKSMDMINEFRRPNSGVDDSVVRRRAADSIGIAIATLDAIREQLQRHSRLPW